MLEILIGLPASRKSTYAREKLEEGDNVIVVSSDSIRKEILGDVNDQSQNDKIFSILKERCLEGVKNNKRVIVDATNLVRKRRINFIKSFPEDTVIFATVFAVPFLTCCERNENRERIVPQEVMDRMYRYFETPVVEEGYDGIALVMEEELKKEEKIDFIEYINIRTPHDNPHHSLTCGEHCLRAEEIMNKIIETRGIEDTTKREILLAAARYHDLSKYKCKTFKTFKGVNGYACFYNHANVSAYDFLCNYCYLPEVIKENCFYIASLIGSHMVFYNGAAAIEKTKRIL